MKKNVKGYVSLISGLISVLFIILAYTVRTTKIVGTDNTFYGFKNVGFACLAIPFAIVALIFGILAMKGRRDTKGPRKASLILAIVMVVVSACSVVVTSMLFAAGNYANKGTKSVIYDSIKDNPDALKLFDDWAKELRK